MNNAVEYPHEFVLDSDFCIHCRCPLMWIEGGAPGIGPVSLECWARKEKEAAVQKSESSG